MEHQYLLTLRGKDGCATALLRLKQGPGGYGLERRDYIPLPEDASLWLFTPGGPVLIGMAKPGPVLGAALVEGGRCLCAGAARGARIDLDREMLRLRLLLQRELSPRAKPAPEAKAAVSEARRPEPEIQQENEVIEEAMVAPATEEEGTEAIMEATVAEEAPAAAEEPSAAAEEWEEEPTVPVMEILPEPKKDTPKICNCAVDLKIEAESELNTTTYGYTESRMESAATEESYEHVPEGAEEVSGREYGWTLAEEGVRRAIWIAGEKSVVMNAEYDAIIEPEETEDVETQRGRSEALQEILARAERAFSDHVPPSPTPVLTEGVEVIAGPAADPVEAREGLAMAIPNPFPNTFPGAEFRRVHRPQGQGWYLQGEMRRGSERWRITAMPGEYRPIPPCALQGFHRYIKSRDGGYWVRIERG